MTKYIGCTEMRDGHINKLRVYTDKWSTETRTAVVEDIIAGEEYRTWFKSQGAVNYTAGPRVNVVEIDGAAYLRTDKNNMASDNLGSLPDLKECPF